MTESGNPKDNAVAERVNNTIKNELLLGQSFYGVSEVKSAIRIAVDFYNNERPHLSLDGITPAEASAMRGTIKKRWKSYRELAIQGETSNAFVSPNLVETNSLEASRLQP